MVLETNIPKDMLPEVRHSEIYGKDSSISYERTSADCRDGRRSAGVPLVN